MQPVRPRGQRHLRVHHARLNHGNPLRGVQPQNDRELYLLAVITDQQDVMFGMTLFMLRMIATLTVGGTGIVLIAAGSTEWELRSHTPVS